MAKKLRRARRTKEEADDKFDKILAYYMEGTELSETLEGVRVRWVHAWTIRTQEFRTREETIKMITKAWNVSPYMARIDVENAMRLFGDINKSNKQIEENITKEYAVKIMRMALEEGNLSEMNKALATYVKATRIDQEDRDLPDFSNVDLPTVVIGYIPDTLKIELPENYEEQIEAMFKIKERQLNNHQDIEDVDHEEIN